MFSLKKFVCHLILAAPLLLGPAVSHGQSTPPRGDVSEEMRNNLLTALRDGNGDSVRWALKELMMAGPAGGPVLIEAMNTSNTRLQLALINIISQHGITEAVPLLITLTSAEDLYLQQWAVKGLGGISDPRAANRLMEIAQDLECDPTLKLITLRSLGHLGDPAAIPLLENLLSQGGAEERLFVAGSLGMLDNSSGFDVAMEHCQGNDEQLRMVAVQALGLIRDVRAIHVLEEIYEGAEGDEKTFAYIALREIEMSSLAPDDAVEFLREDISTDGYIGLWAAETLGANGSPEAVELLISNARDSSGNLRPAVADQLYILGVNAEEL